MMEALQIVSQSWPIALMVTGSVVCLMCYGIVRKMVRTSDRKNELNHQRTMQLEAIKGRALTYE